MRKKLLQTKPRSFSKLSQLLSFFLWPSLFRDNGSQSTFLLTGWLMINCVCVFLMFWSMAIGRGDPATWVDNIFKSYLFFSPEVPWSPSPMEEVQCTSHMMVTWVKSSCVLGGTPFSCPGWQRCSTACAFFAFLRSPIFLTLFFKGK